ncbi:MAG: copper chaperone PCu(A)C [Mycobacteriales bacterium]
MPSRSLVPISLSAALLAVGLAGCGAGLDPETYRERPTVDAALASVGELDLRNVSINPPPAGDAELPAGGTATARLSVINLGERPDVLVSVTSPAATTVELLDAAGAVVPNVPIGGLQALGPSDFTVRLSGLIEPLRPGHSVDMTFTFTNNGRKTLLVPLRVYTVPEPAPSENPFRHEGAEG